LQKVILILFLFLFTVSCSVLKEGAETELEPSNIKDNTGILEYVRSNNLSRQSFFIPKADIEIISGESVQKVFCSIKYEFPDKYMISIKSRTGIEVARVFISKDTILINDRINKKLYYIAGSYTQKRYGITNSAFSVIFGDLKCENSAEDVKSKCINEKLNVDCGIDQNYLSYSIDCRKRKVQSISIINSIDEGRKELFFGNFKMKDGIFFPAKILFNDLMNNTKIKISIRKIQSPWIGKIEFIPGSKYKLVKLL
jgi:hypothetical protein